MSKPAEAYVERLQAPWLSVAAFWNSLRTYVSKSRCRLIHRSISHPIHGKYRCWTCLHEFETDF
jgi:hypothetical protein